MHESYGAPHKKSISSPPSPHLNKARIDCGEKYERAGYHKRIGNADAGSVPRK
jgi:hypothetical protein